MNNTLYLTSPIPPSQNHYTGIRIIKSGGKNIPMVYKTKEAKEYEKKFDQIIREQVELQGYDLPVNDKQHFNVDAVFYFDRIDKDTSNADKVLLDTITGTQLVWKDDNVALFRPQRIYYDNQNPRIELTIQPVDYVGIFDNHEQMHQFEEKCKKCKRYTRNCSILNKAKEGRIQEEIQDMVCSKYKETK